MIRVLQDISRRLRGLWKAESGNIAMISAIIAVPLMALAGGGVDFLVAYRQRSELQGALDAATLAGVTRSTVPDEETKAANDYFKANYLRIAELSAFNFQTAGDRVTGTAAKNVGTSFLKIIGISALPAAARSSATREDYREPLCFMAMHPTRKHTLELNESVSVVAPDCNIYGNSDNVDDVVDPHTAQNFMTGRSVQAIGYGHHYLQNVTPPLEHADELIADPLASLAIPTPTPGPSPAAVAGCNYGGGSAKQLDINGQTIHLQPGVYCKGLKIRNNANVTFDPGMYFIKTGAFTIDASQVTGDNVTIVLSDSAAVIDWKNGSTIRLSGATAPVPYAGIVVMGVRVNAKHALSNSTVDLHGVVYLPNGEFDWENSGTPVINAKWTAWIIDGVSWSGNGVIKIDFQPTGSPVPYPDALSRVIPRKGTPRLLY